MRGWRWRGGGGGGGGGGRGWAWRGLALWFSDQQPFSARRLSWSFLLAFSFSFLPSNGSLIVLLFFQLAYSHVELWHLSIANWCMAEIDVEKHVSKPFCYRYP